MRKLLDEMYSKISGDQTSEMGDLAKFEAIVERRQQQPETPLADEGEFRTLLLTAAKETKDIKIRKLILSQVTTNTEIETDKIIDSEIVKALDENAPHRMKFKEGEELATTVIHDVTEDLKAAKVSESDWEYASHQKRLFKKIDPIANGIQSEVSNNSVWAIVQDDQLTAHIRSSHDCCTQQIKELKKLIELCKASNIPLVHVWKAKVSYFESILGEYNAILEQCNLLLNPPQPTGNANQTEQPVPQVVSPSVTDDQKQATTNNASADSPQNQPPSVTSIREATKDIVARTCAANYRLEQVAQSLEKRIPTAGDIAERVAKNTWHFVKSNKALLMGAALVAVGVALLLTPAAPLGLGLIGKAVIGGLGVLSLPIKGFMNWILANRKSQMIDALSVSDPKGGIWEAKQVIPQTITSIVTAKSNYDTKMPLTKNAETDTTKTPAEPSASMKK